MESVVHSNAQKYTNAYQMFISSNESLDLGKRWKFENFLFIREMIDGYKKMFVETPYDSIFVNKINIDKNEFFMAVVNFMKANNTLLNIQSSKDIMINFYKSMILALHRSILYNCIKYRIQHHIS